MFIALFTIAKPWNQTKCPAADEWMKKMWYIYTEKVLLNHKLKKPKRMQSAATGMGLIILSQQKASQQQKDKYHMISLRCGI